MSASRTFRRHMGKTHQQARAGYHPAMSDGWRPEPGRKYATTPGWAAGKGDVAEVRARTHDTLIKLMGETRTGPVRWLQYEGDQADYVARDCLMGIHNGERVDGSDRARSAEHWREIRALLRERGGHLVVAIAEGRP